MFNYVKSFFIGNSNSPNKVHFKSVYKESSSADANEKKSSYQNKEAHHQPNQNFYPIKKDDLNLNQIQNLVDEGNKGISLYQQGKITESKQILIYVCDNLLKIYKKNSNDMIKQHLDRFLKVGEEINVVFFLNSTHFLQKIIEPKFSQEKLKFRI